MSDLSGPLPAEPASSSSLLPLPLTVGQALSRTVELLRQYLRSFLAIAAIPLVTMIVLEGLMFGVFFTTVSPLHPKNPPDIHPAMIGLIFFIGTIAMVGILLVYALFEAAACFASLQAAVGIKVSMHEAYAVAVHKAGRYVWLSVLRALILVIPVLALMLMASPVLVATAGAKNQPLSATIFSLGLIFVIGLFSLAYALVVMVRLALAYPACIMENLTAWAAVRRGNRLSQGARGRIFLVLLLIWLLLYAVMMLMELAMWLVGMAGVFLAPALHLHGAWRFLPLTVAGGMFFVVILLLSALSWVAYQVVYAVFYNDQRWIREGVAPAAVRLAE